jgi:hypothetical protein
MQAQYGGVLPYSIVEVWQTDRDKKSECIPEREKDSYREMNEDFYRK